MATTTATTMTTTTTTTASLDVYLLTIVPILLIATSSILLDRAMSYETLLHRCQIQIWIWLALFLTASNPQLQSPNMNNTITESGENPRIVCLVYAHLVIFFNLLGIVIEALTQSRAAALSRKQQALQSAVSIVPVSCWWSVMIVAILSFFGNTMTGGTIPSIDSLWGLSLLMFVASCFIAWCLKVFATKRQKALTSMQGIPTTVTTTTSASDSMMGGGIMARLCGMAPLASAVDYNKTSGHFDAWLDERQWFRWTRIQTMQWFAQQLTKASNKEDHHETARVVSVLAAHNITGEVLDGLADVSQLVALKVPFGPAFKLSNAIEGLVERYPKPRIINGIHQRTRGVPIPDLHVSNNDCLDLHDHMYNNNNNNNNEIQRSPPMEEQEAGINDGIQREAAPRNRAPLPNPENEQVFPDSYGIQGGGGMSEEQHEKLNQVMKDRFGLELPKLRATDFLAVQKGLTNKANGKKTSLTVEKISQSDLSHPFDKAQDQNMNPVWRNNNTSGTQPIQLPRKSQTNDQPTSPSALIDEHQNNANLQSSAGIPKNILEGMPPELQEIAERRPDLVEKIWKQRQQALQQHQKLPKRYQNLPVLPETNEGETPADAFEEEFDSDNEDETTSLIHRDNPGRYKAVDKPLYPPSIL